MENFNTQILGTLLDPESLIVRKLLKGKPPNYTLSSRTFVLDSEWGTSDDTQKYATNKSSTRGK